jgi:hypothetical protein
MPKPFVKNDPRINRNGRPKSFDAWRSLTVEILREPAKDKDGNPIVIDGHIATNAEMIARSWMKNSKHQQSLIEAAYGKVPDKLELSGNDGGAIKIGIKPIDYRIAIADLKPSEGDTSLDAQREDGQN